MEVFCWLLAVSKGLGRAVCWVGLVLVCLCMEFVFGFQSCGFC